MSADWQTYSHNNNPKQRIDADKSIDNCTTISRDFFYVFVYHSWQMLPFESKERLHIKRIVLFTRDTRWSDVVAVNRPEVLTSQQRFLWGQTLRLNQKRLFKSSQAAAGGFLVALKRHTRIESPCRSTQTVLMWKGPERKSLCVPSNINDTLCYGSNQYLLPV